MELHENHWADDGGAQFDDEEEFLEEELEEENYDQWFKEDWAIDDDWDKIEPVDDYEKLEDEGI